MSDRYLLTLVSRKPVKTAISLRAFRVFIAVLSCAFARRTTGRQGGGTLTLSVRPTTDRVALALAVLQDADEALGASRVDGAGGALAARRLGWWGGGAAGGACTCLGLVMFLGASCQAVMFLGASCV